ncbi:GNAT family N-acetyltransferase [Ekhidna sp.]|uniref:GNAT family N-acetyltransferase n=1 Tax=Ekhidna sp. TaxID=2608089 RepID=UPI0032F00287
MSRISEIEPLRESSLPEAYLFLETIFTNEQHIPKKLIPLQHKQQLWWCIKDEGAIVGTVAAWKDGKEWHWGRLAVDEGQRGRGLGKKLAIGSFKELFQCGIDQIIIDARDITVELLLSLGAKVTGPTTQFYDIPITPMKLTKSDFEGVYNQT